MEQLQESAESQAEAVAVGRSYHLRHHRGYQPKG